MLWSVLALILVMGMPMGIEVSVKEFPTKEECEAVIPIVQRQYMERFHADPTIQVRIKCDQLSKEDRELIKNGGEKKPDDSI